MRLKIQTEKKNPCRIVGGLWLGGEVHDWYRRVTMCC